MIAGKAFLDYTNLFSTNDYFRMTREYVFTFKTNSTEENAILDFRLKKINETRGFLEQIKKNDLLRKKHKKMCRNLNYLENFLIFVLLVVVFQFLHLLLQLVFL